MGEPTYPGPQHSAFNTAQNGLQEDVDINGKHMSQTEVTPDVEKQTDASSEKELKPVRTIAYCRFIAKRHKLAFGK